jgi:hypothetical protein
MSKIDLDNIESGYALQIINSNFAEIEAELNTKVLYRDNPAGEPNQMTSTLDMNGQKIINLPTPVNPNDAARLQDIVNAVAGGSASVITVTPAGSISATNVQSALEELDSDIITNASNLAGVSSNLNALTPRVTTLESEVGILNAEFAALVGPNTKYVNNLTSFASTNYSSYACVIAGGFYAQGDGGGGVFFNTGTNTAADGGITINDSSGRTFTRAFIGEEVNIKWWGAQEGQDIYTPTIKALNYVQGRGYGTILIPASTQEWLLSGEITVRLSHIKIKGQGKGMFHDAGTGNNGGTQIRWIGVSGGTMISVTPLGNAVRGNRNNEVSGIWFNANGIALYGVYSISCNTSKFDIGGEEFQSGGALLYTGCQSGLSEAADWYHNDVWLSGKNYNTQGALLICTGIANANTCFNHFWNIEGNYKNGIALQIYNTDNNQFHKIQLFRVSGGVVQGCWLHAMPAGQQCRANIFFQFSTGDGGVLSEGTSGSNQAAVFNRILWLDTENGNPAPSVGSGSSLYVGSNHSASAT